ncbi:MAG: flagellar export chaperone FliS [Pseudomonadota bacterium]
MPGSAAVNVYRRTAVNTADGGRLVLMAYEAAMGNLAEAEEALAARDFEAKGRLVARAQEAILELMGGLNPQAGPVAENLRTLYAYMLRTLAVVDPKGEQERIAQVRGMLQELYSAWRTIIDGPELRAVGAREEKKEARW